MVVRLSLFLLTSFSACSFSAIKAKVNTGLTSLSDANAYYQFGLQTDLLKLGHHSLLIGADYSDFSRMRASTSERPFLMDLDTLDLKAGYKYTPYQRLSFGLTAGSMFSMSKVRSLSSGNYNTLLKKGDPLPFAGTSIDYALNDNLTLGAEYRYIWDNSIFGDFSTLSLGLSYRLAGSEPNHSHRLRQPPAQPVRKQLTPLSAITHKRPAPIQSQIENTPVPQQWNKPPESGHYITIKGPRSTDGERPTYAQGPTKTTRATYCYQVGAFKQQTSLKQLQAKWPLDTSVLVTKRSSLYKAYLVLEMAPETELNALRSNGIQFFKVNCSKAQ